MDWVVGLGQGMGLEEGLGWEKGRAMVMGLGLGRERGRVKGLVREVVMVGLPRPAVVQVEQG
jgi:hypothetical protein